MRNGRLQRIEAVVERQQRIAPERDDHRFLLDRQNRRSRGFRTGHQVSRRSSFFHLATVFWLIPHRFARTLRLA